MADFIFIDAGFNATSVEVRIAETASAEARAFRDTHLGGSAVVGATLRKSGAYQMMEALAAAGIKYEVREA